MIFVAMPSLGTVDDYTLKTGLLRESVYRKLADLFDKNPGKVFIAPVITGYLLAPYMEKSPEWFNWRDHCLSILDRCDEVWVLMYEGWTLPTPVMDTLHNISIGVHGEITHALQSGKSVKFVSL